MDLHYILSVYLNRRHSHLKSVKLCSNMAVKNMFTSDLLLDPGEVSLSSTSSLFQWDLVGVQLWMCALQTK